MSMKVDGWMRKELTYGLKMYGTHVQSWRNPAIFQLGMCSGLINPMLQKKSVQWYKMDVAVNPPGITATVISTVTSMGNVSI